MIDVIQDVTTWNNKKVFLLIVIVENNENVYMRRSDIFTTHWEAVFLTKCFNLNIEGSVSPWIMREEVNGLGVSHRNRYLHTTLEEFARGKELTCHTGNL